jgi:hypothetical protein
MAITDRVKGIVQEKLTGVKKWHQMMGLILGCGCQEYH